MMNMKMEIYFKITDNKIDPGNKNIYLMNWNIIMKAYRKYKCAIISNGDDQKVTNLKKWLLLDSHSTVDNFL